MKIVTMCQGGHVRSVALKYILRYLNAGHHDVIACGWEGNTLETRRMLFDWADVIVIMEPQFEEHVPSEFHCKADGTRRLFCYNVGPDRFGTPFHPELQDLLMSMIKQHGLFVDEPSTKETKA